MGCAIICLFLTWLILKYIIGSERSEWEEEIRFYCMSWQIFTAALRQVSNLPFLSWTLWAVSQDMSKELPLESNHFLTVTASWWRARHMSYEFWPVSCESWLRKDSLGGLTEEVPLAALCPEQIQLSSIFGSSSEVQEGTRQPPTPCLITPLAVYWHLFSSSWECVEPRRWKQGWERKGVVLSNVYDSDQKGVHVECNGAGRQERNGIQERKAFGDT